MPLDPARDWRRAFGLLGQHQLPGVHQIVQPDHVEAQHRQHLRGQRAHAGRLLQNMLPERSKGLLQLFASSQDLPTGRLAPVRQRPGPEAARPLFLESVGAVNSGMKIAQRPLHALSAGPTVANQLFVQPQTQYGVTHRVARPLQPFHRPSQGVSRREVLYSLGGQAVGLVEHIDGFLGRRQNACSVHVDRRQHQIVVGDHEVCLLDPLPRGLERTACELRTLGAGAPLAIRGDSLPNLIDHGQRQLVAIPAPTTGVEGDQQLPHRGHPPGCVDATLRTSLPHQVEACLSRELAFGLQLDSTGVAASALGDGKGERDREQALQAGRVLLRVLVLKRHRRTAHHQALVPGLRHHERRHQGTKRLACTGPGLDDREVVAVARLLVLGAAPRQRVGHGRDHLHLRPARPEARNAFAQRLDALADQLLLFIADHAASLRAAPSDSSMFAASYCWPLSIRR